MSSIALIDVRTPTDVGALVRDRRQRLGWKQEDLARRVGVSRQWVVGVEKGKPGAELGLVLQTLREPEAFLLVADGGGPRRKEASAIDRIIAESRLPRR